MSVINLHLNKSVWQNRAKNHNIDSIKKVIVGRAMPIFGHIINNFIHFSTVLLLNEVYTLKAGQYVIFLVKILHKRSGTPKMLHN